MLAIHVELLTGRYVATAHDDRRRAEWPPHPARLFSALVAAHYDCETPNPSEREALHWLENQPAPSMRVSRTAGRRDVLDVFVPVNDVTTLGDLEKPLRDSRAALDRLRGAGASAAELKKAEKDIEKRRTQLRAEIAALSQPETRPPTTLLEAARALLPDRRTRQMRTFPVAIPDDPNVAFVWQAEVPAEVQIALALLCERVTRLGHSSSLVWCRASDQPVVPTLVPRSDGDLVLRVVGPGQVDRLDASFAEHQGVAGRVLPAMPQRYGAPVEHRSPLSSSVFGPEWIVFERVGGARIFGSRTADLTRVLRAALLEQHGVPGMPLALSGHDPDGRPTNQPHLAFVALPFVGAGHADGSIKGVAIVPPRDLSPADQELLFRLIAQWESKQPDARITLAGPGLPPVLFKRVEVATTEAARPMRWCRASKRFVTATPIALDRNPGNLRSNLDRTAHKAAEEARATIAASCEAIGLPRPVEVEISFAPLLQGAQSSGAYLAARSGKTQRVRVHAELRFDVPVRGPLLIGAGRHFGLGLCLPVGDGS